MATNRLKYLFFAFIFLGFTVSLMAQDEPRLTQRFSWSGGEYALRYEVVFEQLVNNNYVHHSRHFITQRFVEVSLTIGDYRFRIIPYDILNKPRDASEWKNFKIIPMPKYELKPETDSQLEFVPDYELSDEEREPVIEAAAEPEIIKEPEPLPAVVIETQPEPEAEEEKNLYALKPVLFNAGAIVSMQFPFYGDEINENISLFSFGARLSAVFALPLDIYIGPELTASLYQFKKEYNLFFLAPGINLITLKWLSNEKIAFGVRLGAMYLYYSSDGFSTEDLMPNIGAMFRWRFSPLLALDAGIDYFHMFRVAPGGYIRPHISIGIQL